MSSPFPPPIPPAPGRAWIHRPGTLAQAVLALTGLLTLLLFPACRQPPSEVAPRPNIVLVVLCSFRLDHMGFYGYDRPTTPFLDSLAADSVTFDSAFSASSWTKPSTASLLTGLTPNVHRLVDPYSIEKIRRGDEEPPRTLPEGIETLAEGLGRAGYATGCRINNVNAGELFQLDRGCDDRLTRHRYPTGQMLDDLADFLSHKNPEQPFFYLLFTLDAHVPYTPTYEDFQRFNRDPARDVPETELDAYLLELTRGIRRATEQRQDIPPARQQAFIDTYDAALASLDHRLSRLPEVLARAGVAEQTLIVVTADHGESFFEPGRQGPQLTTHGFDLAETLIRIPMIFHGPDMTPGRRVAGVARSIDLLPTLFELAGAPIPAIAQGRSLRPLLRGKTLGQVTAFSSRANGHHHAVHDGRFKLELREPDRYQLFDTRLDRHGTHDLLAEQSAVARRLRRQLERWREQERVLEELVGQAGQRQLDPETKRHLEALGYL